MDHLVFLLVILLAFLLLLGITLGISSLIYRFLTRRKYNQTLRFFAFVPLLLPGYILYTSLYPRDSFFEADFKEVTGLYFPQKGEILYKTATFPDHLGNHTSLFFVHVGQKFYESLPEKLLSKGLTENQEKIRSMKLKELLKRTGNKIEKEFSLQQDGAIYYYVGFLSDKKTLIVKRMSGSKDTAE